MNAPPPGDTIPSSVDIDPTVAAMAASTALPPASATALPASAAATDAAAMTVRDMSVTIGAYEAVAASSVKLDSSSLIATSCAMTSIRE